MKKFIIIILFLSLTIPVQAEVDTLTDFGTDSVSILNENLRKIDKAVTNSDVTGSYFVVTAGDSTLTNESVLTGTASEITVTNATISLASDVNMTSHRNILPNAADVSGYTDNGSIAWDNDDFKLYVGNGTGVTAVGNNVGMIGVVFDNGTSNIATGSQAWIYMPYACTITGWTMLADRTPNGGGMIVDVWKDVYANFPPTAADKISGSESPTLTALNNKAQDLNLTTWTDLTVEAGDVVMFNVTSNLAKIAPRKCTITLNTTK